MLRARSDEKALVPIPLVMNIHGRGPQVAGEMPD
jgi:hypothetical protein